MKPTDPEKNVGVYKLVEEVPSLYRFDDMEMEFEGRDVCEEYKEKSDILDGISSQSVLRRLNTALRRWKNHTAEYDCHHALATPKIVDEWFSEILEECTVSTVYHSYFSHIDRLYLWLMRRRDYPHIYSPVRMAAVQYSTTREVWDFRVNR